MRILPYRTVDNVIGGVVITFVDITRITAAEARIGELTADLRNRLQSLETLLNLLPVGILIVEDDRADPVRVNRYGALLLGESGEGGDGAGFGRPRTALRIFQGDRELRAGRAAAAPRGAFRPGRIGLRGPRSSGPTAAGSTS